MASKRLLCTYLGCRVGFLTNQTNIDFVGYGNRSVCLMTALAPYVPLLPCRLSHGIKTCVSSKQQQQALKKSLRPHCGSKPASKWLKATGELRRITTNKFRCVSSRLAGSTANLLSKNGRFWAVLGCFQGDHPKSSERSPLRQAGVSDEGRCSFMAIGVLKDGKWVFNKACTTPWCHAVDHFEVKMSCFPAAFQDHRRH